MKPVAWRVFRNNRWTYSEDNRSRHDERHLWQPLYTDMDIQAKREVEREALPAQGGSNDKR
jgi:hypothetical protein